jgi:hypothetical protein
MDIFIAVILTLSMAISFYLKSKRDRLVNALALETENWYSIWSETPKGGVMTMTKGRGKPKYKDGTEMPDCNHLVGTFQAENWDQAVEHCNKTFKIGSNPW